MSLSWTNISNNLYQTRGRTALCHKGSRNYTSIQTEPGHSCTHFRTINPLENCFHLPTATWNSCLGLTAIPIPSRSVNAVDLKIKLRPQGNRNNLLWVEMAFVGHSPVSVSNTNWIDWRVKGFWVQILVFGDRFLGNGTFIL